MNADGCDSLIQINLIVESIDLTVTQNGAELIANQTGAMYQWLNCTDMTPIAGATNQSYIATSNGNYAVAIINNYGCKDTSECFTVEGIGIIENDFGSKFIVYPNPTDGNLSINLGNTFGFISIKLKDINGKVFWTKEFEDKQLLNLAFDAASGTYLLVIESENKKAVIQLVKL